MRGAKKYTHCFEELMCRKQEISTNHCYRTQMRHSVNVTITTKRYKNAAGHAQRESLSSTTGNRALWGECVLSMCSSSGAGKPEPMGRAAGNLLL